MTSKLFAKIKVGGRVASLAQRLMLGSLALWACTSLRAELHYDFDDGSLQGWSDLTAVGSQNGPRHWAIAPPAFPESAHEGAGAIRQQLAGGNQDNAHPTLWLRSPPFKLDGSGNLIAWLSGGTGSGSLAGMNASAVPSQSSSPGFQGLALRNAETDEIVLSVSKPGNGDAWQSVAFTAGRLAGLNQGAPYTLELIDAGHGSWGWLALDSVSIPGERIIVPTPPPVPDPMEPLGPSSRRTGWVISEIQFRPGAGGGPGFVEIHNPEPVPQDLGGYRLEGAVNFTFPAGTSVAPGGFVVVSADPSALEAAHQISGVLGPYAGNLNREQVELQLRHPGGAVLLEAVASTELDWPAAADGTGHSLVLARPSYGEADVRAWSASRNAGGSPGTFEPEPDPDDPYGAIFINEFLANTALPQLDFIELHNDGPAAVDLSGCWLSDKPEQSRFEIPEGTVLEAGGYVVFYETALGFALSSSGEGIYLRTPDAARVIDALRFIAQDPGIASGRWPDAAAGIRELATPTPGSANASPRIPDVVINEIHYHPLSGDEDETFVELHNRSGAAVDVSGWQLSDGIRFTIPQSTAIASGGFLVIGKNRSRLLEIYPQLAPTATLGGFGGRLSRSGERITLLKPGDSAAGSVLVDEVHYRDGGAWHGKADGKGSSLERIDPRANGRLAPNWAASDEAGRGDWTTVEHTGVLDHGMGTSNQVHLILLASGECLVDNVEVRVGTGGNRVGNSGFESGLTGWSITGNHVESTLSAPGSGFGGGRALHLRASGGGDTGANSIRGNLSFSVSAGQTVTIRARVRWLSGHPGLLVRLRGSYLEAVGEPAVARGGGTPGASNSRAIANAGPAISAVRHDPPMPAVNQPVTVLARVEDPDGVAGVFLRYRIDPATLPISVPMQRNGPRGYWSAVIPGQASGRLAAFHVVAGDAAPGPREARFPAAAPAAECLVRWGEPPVGGDFGHYRFWLTQAVHDQWSQREKLSNHRLDSTFVYQGSRIIYNAGGRFRGSPFIRPSYNTPTGNLCSYVYGFPSDEPFLGSDQINLDNLEPGRDPSRQSEKMSFWLAEQIDSPFVHQRYVILHLNGVRRDQVFTDSQHLDSDYIKSWFPEDREGAFHKIDDWFEFNSASGGFTSQRDATLQNFTTTGNVKKKARYRWSWEKRRSVSLDDDFDELFTLVDSLNLPAGNPAYLEAIERQINLEKWLRTLALRRLVGDWDSYGFNRGKNMSAYKSANGWQLLPWDIDFTLGASSSSPDVALFTSHDPTIATLLAQPAFRRIYLRAFHDAVHGPFQVSAMDPMMNAWHSAFIANGLSISGPGAIRNWVQARRNYILTQLAAVDAPLALATNGGNDFTSPSAQVILEGSAPIEAAGIQINGVAFPVEWTSVNSWRIQVPLGGGANALSITGTDVNGAPIPGIATSVTVTYDGIIDEAGGHLVINEIMMRPEVSGAEFVEIHNRSLTTAFDLTQYRLRGVDFDFSPGTVIAPGGFLLVVRDDAIFQATHGSGLPIAGTYNGVLQQEGERLQLVKRATAGQPERLISEVSYSSAPPWPQLPAEGGASLQLIDSSQGAHHIGNWASSDMEAPPEWQRVVLTGSNLGDRLYLFLGEAGAAFIDDMHLNVGSMPESGPNLLVNGDFESPLTPAWEVAPNHGFSSLSTEVKRSGESSLRISATSPGIDPIGSHSISQTSAEWADGSIHTLSFWYLPQQEGVPMTVRFRFAGFRPESINHSFNTRVGFASGSTPGQPNSVARTLPFFPNLHINEVQALNLSGPADSTGSRGPWLELYHQDLESLSLDGFFLSDDPTHLAKWPLPSAAAMPAAGFRMVWLDGRDHLTTADAWHSSFMLAAPTATLTLSRIIDGAPVVISHLAFPALPGDASYGPWPDGSAEAFLFPEPTPGSSNAEPGVQLAELVMPRFMQGSLPNSARVPFAFRVRLGGLLPGADYRIANRVIVPGDPPTQNGAGNQVFVTPGLPYPRTTNSPGFLADQYLTGHQRITTDAAGYYEGWFITEPSGNARFTPGNTVFIRLLLNDGQEGESIAHFIDCPSPIQVLSFGSAPGQGSAVQGVAASHAGDFILLEDSHPSGRPVAATVVEKALSSIDSSYAEFYQSGVWPHVHAWGTLIPNSLPGGVTGISELSRSTGELLSRIDFGGPWPGTVDPSSGSVPLTIDAINRYPFWQRARFPNPADLANPAISGPAADGLGLGVSNLLAYALGLEPDDPANAERRLGIVTTPAGAWLRFPRDPWKVDVVYLLAASPDLATWPETLYDSRDDDRPNNDGDFLTIEDPAESAAGRFFQLQILPLDP